MFYCKVPNMYMHAKIRSRSVQWVHWKFHGDRTWIFLPVTMGQFYNFTVLQEMLFIQQPLQCSEAGVLRRDFPPYLEI